VGNTVAGGIFVLNQNEGNGCTRMCSERVDETIDGQINVLCVERMFDNSVPFFTDLESQFVPGLLLYRDCIADAAPHTDQALKMLFPEP
jgi:hypothetical protein